MHFLGDRTNCIGLSQASPPTSLWGARAKVREQNPLTLNMELRLESSPCGHRNGLQAGRSPRGPESPFATLWCSPLLGLLFLHSSHTTATCEQGATRPCSCELPAWGQGCPWHSRQQSQTPEKWDRLPTGPPREHLPQLVPPGLAGSYQPRCLLSC